MSLSLKPPADMVTAAIIRAAVDRAVYKYGSLSRAAIWLEMDKGHLSKLRSGQNLNPSSETLLKLGLKRVVRLEFASPD
jgi:hypothetical protein